MRDDSGRVRQRIVIPKYMTYEALLLREKTAGKKVGRGNRLHDW